MAQPIIRSNGTTSGPVVGPGRDNCVVGETLYFTDTHPDNVGANYLWALEDAPIGSTAVLANATSPSASLLLDRPGSYRVSCTVGGVLSRQVIGVPLPVTGSRIPSYLEEDWYGPFGWHAAMTDFMIEVDTRLGLIPPPPFGAVGLITTIDVGDTAAAGISAFIARADHQHALAAPTVINDVSAAASALGVSAKVAREDHSHFHGNLAGGSLHALATTSLNGFMAAADKAADFITTTAQASLPNSRRLAAGTNVTFNVGTPGVLTVNATGGVGTGTVGRVPYFGAGGVFTEGAAAPAHIHFDSSNGRLSPGGSTIGYFVTDPAFGTRMAWSTIMLTVDSIQMIAATPFWWQSWSGATGVEHRVSNTSGEATAHAIIEARVAGATSGNPRLRMNIAGVRTAEMLLDNAASDVLKIKLDSATRIVVDSATMVFGADTTTYGYTYEFKNGAGPAQVATVSTGVNFAAFTANSVSSAAAVDVAMAPSSNVYGDFLGSATTNYAILRYYGGAVGFKIGSSLAAPLIFGTSDTVRLTLDATGNAVMGTGALATTATNGFLFITGGPGTPTGVPTAYTGRTALYYDTTANLLYANDGGGWTSTGGGGGGFTPSGAYRVPFANNLGTTLVDSAFFRFDPNTNVLRSDGPNAYLQLSEGGGSGIFYTGSLYVIVGATQIVVSAPLWNHTWPVAGSTAAALVYNTSNTASSAARHEVRVAGATAANPSYRLNIDGLRTYDFLINNADADSLELHQDGVRKFQFSASYIYGDTTNPWLRLDNATGAWMGYGSQSIKFDSVNASVSSSSGTFIISGQAQLMNFGINTGSGVGQGMRGGIAIYPGVNPTSNPPTNEIFVYNDAGLLKARQSNGVITTIVPASGGGGGFTPGGARRMPYANTGGTALIDNAGLTFNDTTYTFYGQGGSLPYLTLNTSSGAVLGYAGYSAVTCAVNGVYLSGGTIYMGAVLVDQTFSSSGGTVSTFTYNSSNTASSAAVSEARVAGSAAGNPAFRLNVSSLRTVDSLIDNADVDAWKVRIDGTTILKHVANAGNLHLLVNRDGGFSSYQGALEVWRADGYGMGVALGTAATNYSGWTAYNHANNYKVEIVQHGSSGNVYGNFLGSASTGWGLLTQSGGSGLKIGSYTGSVIIGTNDVARITLPTAGNMAIFGAGSFGGGVGVTYQANATTEPTSAPSGGGLIWVFNGQWKVMGTSGVPIVIS